MNAEVVSNLGLAVVLGISLYTDLTKRVIYNRVVIPALLIGLGVNIWDAGLNGLFFSLQGIGLGLAVLLLPFIMGGMGAGDVKLLAVVGAFKGMTFVWYSFVATALYGGLLVVLVLLKRKMMLTSLQGLCRGLYILLASNGRVNTFETLEEDESAASVPYGVAIALGALTTFLVVK